MLGNQSGLLGLARCSLEPAERSSHLLSRQPPVPPAVLPAASPCVAESLPLAPRSRLRLPRPLSAHLPESQSPREAKRPGRRRGLQAPGPLLPGHGHLHLHLHQPAPGPALPAPPLPGQHNAAVSEQAAPVGSPPAPSRSRGMRAPSPPQTSLCCSALSTPAEINFFPKELSRAWRHEARRGTGGLPS